MASPSRYLTAASTLCGVGVLLLAAAPISGKDIAPWRDDCLARLEVANLLVDLNIELLKQRSATVVLESWCRAHAMAAEPRIVADRVPGAAKPATAEQMQRLHVKDSSQLRYRSVALRCGEHVLSRADNWYVPERLSPEMNRLLDTTDTPFGKVVAGLQPTRSTIEVQTLWSAMPAGWSCARFDPSAETFPALEIPSALFQVRALLRGADGLPFSEVNEVYQGALLNFTEPAREGADTDRLSGTATKTGFRGQPQTPHADDSPLPAPSRWSPGWSVGAPSHADRHGGVVRAEQHTHDYRETQNTVRSSHAKRGDRIAVDPNAAAQACECDGRRRPTTSLTR